MKQTQTSSSAAKCRLIYNKHWHGRNRQKDNTLSEAERLETGKCILCQAPDSQEHTLHYCMDPTLTQLRREILTNLNTLVQEHDKASNLHRQVGRAFLHVLDTANEPGRFWIGNLSTTQTQEITNLINPDELSSLTQAQLNKIFLPLHRVLAEGCTSLMHHKLIREKHTQTPQQAQQSRIPPKTSIVTDNTKPTKCHESTTSLNRSPRGRLLYRQLSAPTICSTSELHPVIRINSPTTKDVKKNTPLQC